MFCHDKTNGCASITKYHATSSSVSYNTYAHPRVGKNTTFNPTQKGYRVVVYVCVCVTLNIHMSILMCLFFGGVTIIDIKPFFSFYS